MKKRCLTVAMLAASMLALNACGSGAAEAVTTAAVTSAAEETTAAAEETTAAAETTLATEETTVAEESSSAAEEAKDEKESAEAESKDEKAVKDETKAEEKAEAAEKETKAEETTAAETKAASTGAAPADIYSKLTSYLPTMVSFDDSYISNYYGIDAAQLDGYVFAAAEDVTQADTVVILKAKDAASVSTLSSQLTTVKQQKEAELQDYNPTAYQVAAAGFVKTSGNYVYLIMSGNASQIDQVISANVG